MELPGKIWKWLRTHYDGITKSIAFIPAIVALAFLALSVLMLAFDYSEAGKHIKSNISWLSLKDASTARDITGTIAGGMISLLVFSFSLVMILLNQAASKMSNRILPSLISNRFQQSVLGFYVGTIVYALFLLSTIRDINSGIYVPALSIYLLILFAIIDIFLFIYFLHYVTQSVKYEVVIQQLHEETKKAMKQLYALPAPDIVKPLTDFVFVPAPVSGYLQGGGKEELIQFCKNHNCAIELLHQKGTYLLKGTRLLKLNTPRLLSDAQLKELLFYIDFYPGQPIDSNPTNGFHQLKEIAITALSPGINDPGTALLCVQALSDLLRYRLCHHPKTHFRDEEGHTRIIIPEIPFAQLLRDCLLPVWDYAQQDRIVLTGLYDVLEQLAAICTEAGDKQAIEAVLGKVHLAVTIMESNHP